MKHCDQKSSDCLWVKWLHQHFKNWQWPVMILGFLCHCVIVSSHPEIRSWTVCSGRIYSPTPLVLY